MASPVVRFKRSSVAGKVPTVEQLPLGEIAINTADGILYLKTENNGIVSITALQASNETIVLSGDASGSGSSLITVTLASSGVVAGTYNNSATAITPITVDAKGRVTSTGTAVTITPAFSSITNTPTTLTGYGITDAATSTHTHGNITNAGAIGSTANLPIITTTSGVLTTGSFGNTANTFCQGNDARLSDTRNTTNSLTFNNGGAGSASGTAFNGSSAVTVSYNTVGAPSTTGANASGNWGINITGSSASCTGNAATATSATSATVAGSLSASDNRTIAPNEIGAGRAVFGFTSWANNDTSPYADYIHFRGYTDATGGNDNLLMLNRNALGIRIWQQSYGSATAYSTYKDVCWTDGSNASGSWGINITGNSASCTGNSATATKLSSARSLALTGDIAGSVTSDLDSGFSISTSIASGVIVDGDVSPTAAIAGTKISPNFGSQTITTTGVVSAAAGAAGTPSISFTGDLNTGLYSPGADQVAISTGGSGRLFVDASGNIKVGTGPGQIGLLDVRGNVVSFTNFRSYVSSVDAANTRGFRQSIDGAELLAFYHTNTAAVFEVNASERLRITSAGLVGVGTSSPAATFHCVGNGLFRASTVGTQATLPSESSAFSILNGTGYNASPSVSLNIGASNHDSVNNNTGFQWRITTPSTAGTGANLTFNSYSFDGTSTYTTTPRMVITSTGNVGIGTTSPSYLLDVAGTARIGATTGDATLEIGTGASANRNAYIDLVGDTTYTDYGTRIIRQAGGANADSRIQHRGTGALALETAEAGASIVFLQQPGERARIDSSGRLLVGTSSARLLFTDYTPTIQLEGTTNSTSSASLINNSNGAAGPTLFFAKSRATSNGGVTVVSADDELGVIAFNGADGTDLTNIGATIKANVDGTPGNNDLPTRLVFSTTADGASSPTERMRIDSAGNVGIGTASPGSALNIGADGDFWLSSSVNTVEEKNLISWRIEDGSEGARISAFREALENAPHSIIFSTRTSDGLTDEKARIDSSGSLLVGTSSSSADAKFIVQGGKSSLAGAVNIQRNTITVPSANRTIGFINFTNSANDVGATISATSDGAWSAGTSHPTQLAFSTTADGASSPTERARIDSVGRFGVGKTPDGNIATTGFETSSEGYILLTRASTTPLYVNRKTNDGNLVEFFQDTFVEGSISVSGTTVSYNGAHLSRWSQLPSGAERTEILRGSVLSNIDEMCEWGDEGNEQLNRMKVSDVEGDKNVSGVFQAWDDDDDTYTNDFYCAMTGDFIIRIGAGVIVERGDLLMSAGDGTAKPQDDDIIRSKTIAKVTSTNVSCTYDDGSYCVPCVLMAC